MAIKGVFFDLDGTLIEAQEWHKKAFDLALGDFGHPPLTREEHISTFNGLSTFRKLKILVEQGRFIDNKAAHIKFNTIKQKYTVELIKENCRPVQRVLDVVGYASSNYCVALVTNCSRETTDLMLERSELKGLFGVTITNNDVSGLIKPDPFPYVLAQLHFELSPIETLAVEDNMKGVKSVLAAKSNIWHLTNFGDLTVDNLKYYIEVCNRREEYG